MTSFQISITPSRREAARFVNRVRRSFQKALTEENKKRGLTQSDIARTIGVHRSVINREIRGFKDITAGRMAELAFALGRKPIFDLPVVAVRPGANAAAPPITTKVEVSEVSATSAEAELVEPERAKAA